MQLVSNAYKREMERIERDRTNMRVNFYIVDVDAAPDASLTDNGHMFYSDISSSIYIDDTPKSTYATFEKSRLLVDGSQLVPSKKEPYYQRYVSSMLSNENCVYTTQPTITATFSKKHSCCGLTFLFDGNTGDFATELKIEVYSNGKIKETLAAYPDSVYYIFFHEFENFDALKIKWVKSNKPYRRARLHTLLFGAGMRFENDLLVETSQIQDIDPISRRLEESTFEFTVINEEGLYNPDNPTGIWKYIEEKQPIHVEYGQRIRTGLTWADAYSQNWEQLDMTDWKTVYEGGFLEWFNGGRYVLNGEPSTKEITATFKGRSALMDLVNPYHKGAYSPAGVTLWDLAQTVLSEAELSNISEYKKSYYLDEGLKKIKTTAPLPKTSFRECLQLIAHAAGMIAYTDRDGIIRIEPIPSAQYDLHLDFNSIYDWPGVTKVAPLYGVQFKVYDYKPSTEITELHKGNYTPGSYMVEFPFATGITVSGVKSFTPMSGSVNFTVEKSGEVIVSGYPLLESSCYVWSYTGKSGETELVDNPLITDKSSAPAIAKQIRDYLLFRNTYEFDYRGSPEIEALDNIYIQSRFSEHLKAKVLRHQIDFNGALKGRAIVKGLI